VAIASQVDEIVNQHNLVVLMFLVIDLYFNIGRENA
jgi:hypothetical protein